MSVLIDADDRHRTSTAINPPPFSQTKEYVEVVRCKDCKHYWKNSKSEDDTVAVCLASPKEDAFCSEGERRNDERTD